MWVDELLLTECTEIGQSRHAVEEVVVALNVRVSLATAFVRGKRPFVRVGPLGQLECRRARCFQEHTTLRVGARGDRAGHVRIGGPENKYTAAKAGVG